MLRGSESYNKNCIVVVYKNMTGHNIFEDWKMRIKKLNIFLCQQLMCVDVCFIFLQPIRFQFLTVSSSGRAEWDIFNLMSTDVHFLTGSDLRQDFKFSFINLMNRNAVITSRVFWVVLQLGFYFSWNEFYNFRYLPISVGDQNMKTD